jgi:hypothetical protein
MIGPIAVGCLVAALAVPDAPDDVVMKAMRDELARNLEQLRLPSLDRPYFIAYTVAEEASLNASASFGATLSSNESRSRRITVEVRVGDPKVDNTGYVAAPNFGGSGVVRSISGIVSLPLDDDYKEIRRQIWLATDAAYKRALENLSRKRAYLQAKTRSDDAPDFGEAEPAVLSDVEAPPPAVRLSELEALTRSLSAVFRDIPDVATSRTSLSGRALLKRYVNSEGSAFTRTAPRLTLTVEAATQAEDGTPLEDQVTAYGRSLADLPSAAELRREVEEMGRRLATLRKAPHLETYNGPVLFEGRAAGELFARVFAPKLLAMRRPIVDDDRFASMMDTSQENAFLDRIGGRVLPAGISVVDDPTRREHGGKALLGGYKVDDDGVPARETRVVENGLLKALLTTRTPVRSLLKSTGNRRGPGPMASNLVVSSPEGPAAAELREALIKAVKDRGAEYGIIVRRLGNPASELRMGGSMMFSMGSMASRDRGEGVAFAVRVFPDGREEPVRIAEIVGLRAESFKDVTASRDTIVHTTLSRPPSVPFMPPVSGSELVSFAVPSLLFEEVSLRRPRTESPRPPVLAPPTVAP